MAQGNLNQKYLNLDLYGRNVKLTFRGEEKFRTKFGAFCTLVVFILMTTYTLTSLASLLNPKPSIPIQSKISHKNFYQVYKGIDNVRERDGTIGKLKSM